MNKFLVSAVASLLLLTGCGGNPTPLSGSVTGKVYVPSQCQSQTTFIYNGKSMIPVVTVVCSDEEYLVTTDKVSSCNTDKSTYDKATIGQEISGKCY